jgi:hypothetical protein
MNKQACLPSVLEHWSSPLSLPSLDGSLGGQREELFTVHQTQQGRKAMSGGMLHERRLGGPLGEEAIVALDAGVLSVCLFDNAHLVSSPQARRCGPRWSTGQQFQEGEKNFSCQSELLLKLEQGGSRFHPNGECGWLQLGHSWCHSHTRARLCLEGREVRPNKAIGHRCSARRPCYEAGARVRTLVRRDVILIYYGS